MSQKIGNLFNALVLTGIALPLAYSAGTLTALIAHGPRIAVEHEPDGYGKRVHLTSPLLKFEKSHSSALHRKFRTNILGHREYIRRPTKSALLSIFRLL